MVAIGDIVEVRQFPGQRWAGHGPGNNVPPGRLWRGGGATGPRSVAAGHRTAAASATAISGCSAMHDPGRWSERKMVGREAEVLRDDGDSHCACVISSFTARRSIGSSSRTWRERTIQICETDIERGDLVAQEL